VKVVALAVSVGAVWAVIMEVPVDYETVRELSRALGPRDVLKAVSREIRHRLGDLQATLELAEYAAGTTVPDQVLHGMLDTLIYQADDVNFRGLRSDVLLQLGKKQGLINDEGEFCDDA
jgi:hypothetical protein